MTLLLRLFGLLLFLLLFSVSALHAQWHPHPDSVTRFMPGGSNIQMIPTSTGGLWTVTPMTDSVRIQYIDENGRMRWLGGKTISMPGEEINNKVVYDDEIQGLYFIRGTGRWVLNDYIGQTRLSFVDTIGVERWSYTVQGWANLVKAKMGNVYLSHYTSMIGNSANLTRIKSGKVTWTRNVRIEAGMRNFGSHVMDQVKPLATKDGGFATLFMVRDTIRMQRVDTLGNIRYSAKGYPTKARLSGMFPIENRLGCFITERNLYYQEFDLDGNPQFLEEGLLIKENSPNEFIYPIYAVRFMDTYHFSYALTYAGKGYLSSFNKKGNSILKQFELEVPNAEDSYGSYNWYRSIKPALNGQGIYLFWQQIKGPDSRIPFFRLLKNNGIFLETDSRPVALLSTFLGGSGWMGFNGSSWDYEISVNEQTGQINAFVNAQQPNAILGRRINCPGCNVILTNVTPASTSLCAGNPLSATYLTHGLPASTAYRAELIRTGQSPVDLGTQTGTSPSFTLPTSVSAGAYRLRVTATGAFTATALSTDSVRVNALPVVAVSGSTSVLQGQPLSLSATGGQTYQWSGPNGFTATGASVQVSAALPTQTGTYSATATSADGCAATAQVNVAVSPLLSAEPVGALGWRVYPNPTHDRLTVERPTRSPQPVQLLNAQGRVVGQYVLTQEKQVLDVSALSSGTYWLQPSQSETKAGVRFVKE